MSSDCNLLTVFQSCLMFFVLKNWSSSSRFLEHESDMHPLQVGLVNDPQKSGMRGTLGVGRSHTTARKMHQCPCCLYTTISYSHLREHYRTHTGEKPFACPHCTYQSATKRDLKKHVRTHTGEKPFSCPFCLYRSATSSDLRKHSRTHNRSKLLALSVPVTLEKN